MLFRSDPAEMNKLRQAHVALQGDLNALLPALQQPLNIDDWPISFVSLHAQNERYGYS